MLYKDYMNKIRDILDDVENTQSENIEKAAKMLAKAIKNDGVLHVFGCGHSQMFAMEVFYRAGGLVPVNAILTPALSLAPKAPLSTVGERQENLAKAILDNETITENDIMLVASTSARNPVPVEMAMEAKKRGLKVITLLSEDFARSVSSRHPSGKKTYDFADVIFDNRGVSGDAAMEIEGLETKFGPTSSIIGFTMIQAMVVEAVDQLVKDGITPPIWVSSNLDKGDAINKKHIKKYRSRITNL